MRISSFIAVAYLCSALSTAFADTSVDVSCPAPPDTLDCSPKRDCSLRHDDRACNACLVKNPFGGCIARGHDPACEAAKASQDQIYSVQKATCEAQKSQEKASCEATKAVLQARIAQCDNHAQ